MGSGIAPVIAQTGFSVLLSYTNPRNLAKSMATIKKKLEWQVRFGKIASEDQAVAYPCRCDLLDLFHKCGLRAAPALAVVTRSLGPQHLAGPPDADLPGCTDLIDELAPPRRP